MSIGVVGGRSQQSVSLSHVTHMQVKGSWSGFGGRTVTVEDGKNVQVFKFDDLIKNLGAEIKKAEISTDKELILKDLVKTFLAVKNLDQSTRKSTHRLFHASIFSARSSLVSTIMSNTLEKVTSLVQIKATQIFISLKSKLENLDTALLSENYVAGLKRYVPHIQKLLDNKDVSKALIFLRLFENELLKSSLLKNQKPAYNLENRVKLINSDKQPVQEPPVQTIVEDPHIPSPAPRPADSKPQAAPFEKNNSDYDWW